MSNVKFDSDEREGSRIEKLVEKLFGVRHARFKRIN